ncbi:hypothetical protein ABEF79_06095 [Acinetobacter sp. ANC 7454]|uniref:hypothetical protein n=1 Tax=Acinetobacter thermotolerans TaxID=3151487 RepID=UPI00325A900C
MRKAFLLLWLLLPAICHSKPLLQGFDISQALHDKAIAPWVIWAIATAVFAVAVGVYTYLQTRKMQKKNRLEASQLDGSITGEGTIVHDIAGSPHVYGNDVDKFNFSTSEIKQKSGGK